MNALNNWTARGRSAIFCFIIETFRSILVKVRYDLFWFTARFVNRYNMYLISYKILETWYLMSKRLSEVAYLPKASSAKGLGQHQYSL